MICVCLAAKLNESTYFGSLLGPSARHTLVLRRPVGPGGVFATDDHEAGLPRGLLLTSSALTTRDRRGVRRDRQITIRKQKTTASRKTTRAMANGDARAREKSESLELRAPDGAAGVGAPDGAAVLGAADGAAVSGAANGAAGVGAANGAAVGAGSAAVHAPRVTLAPKSSERQSPGLQSAVSKSARRRTRRS